MVTKAKKKCPSCGREFKSLGLHLDQSIKCGGRGARFKMAAAAEAAPPPTNLPPGTIIRRSEDVPPEKVRWTREHLETMFPKRTIIAAPESCPVTFQGVTYYIKANEDQDVPAPIEAIYRDYLKSRSMPATRTVGATVEERANQVSFQGVGLLSSIGDEE